MTTITISKSKLLELTLQARLARLAHSKGLHAAVSGDLARRAVESGCFDLDRDGELVERQPVADWLNDLEESGGAAYFFEQVTPSSRPQQSPYGELSKAEFEKLSPERKLAIANELETRKRAS